ncbi:TIGR02450 family Trp-rich protein [Salinisphaera sp. T31B1]|uniref:TIGR02450 family Trp-rich protein n=1 Tax=Salinisphaera sp. T31B1 TaxID=727963 RepID=UPI00333F2F0B
MNRIHPNKLANSKWTALAPQRREKHFIVIEVIRDDREQVADVVLEAVLTRRRLTLAWRALTDDDTWQMGWQ